MTLIFLFLYCSYSFLSDFNCTSIPQSQFNSFAIDHTAFLDCKNLKGSGGAISITSNSTSNIVAKITNSAFVNCICPSYSFGGAIFAQATDLNLSSICFSQCQASTGVCIYSISSDIFQMDQIISEGNYFFIFFTKNTFFSLSKEYSVKYLNHSTIFHGKGKFLPPLIYISSSFASLSYCLFVNNSFKSLIHYDSKLYYDVSYSFDLDSELPTFVFDSNGSNIQSFDPQFTVSKVSIVSNLAFTNISFYLLGQCEFDDLFIIQNYCELKFALLDDPSNILMINRLTTDMPFECVCPDCINNSNPKFQIILNDYKLTPKNESSYNDSMIRFSQPICNFNFTVSHSSADPYSTKNLNSSSSLSSYSILSYIFLSFSVCLCVFNIIQFCRTRIQDRNLNQINDDVDE